MTKTKERRENSPLNILFYYVTHLKLSSVPLRGKA